MRMIDRRTFMKHAGIAASVGAMAHVGDIGWLSFAQAASAGYFETTFGITDALCRRVLERALAKGGDFAELFFEHTLANFLLLEDGKVNQAYGNVRLGVGIRTVKGDQIGYAVTQELTEASMLKAAGAAASIAQQKARPVPRHFVAPRFANHYPMKTLFSAVPLSSKLPLVQATNDRCFAKSKLVAKVTAGFSDEQKRMLVASSDGRKVEDLQPLSSIFATVVIEKGGRRETAGCKFGGRRDFSYYNSALVDRLADTAVGRGLDLLEAVQAPAGEMPVVLGPGGIGTLYGGTGVLLHEAIGHGMEAGFNRKKQSVFATMLGKRVAAPFVTIVDDATNPELSGSLNVDDEGQPGQKTVLVENGILIGYMHDRISAAHYKVAPSGNGRRQSYEHYPQPRMRNTYMLGGQAAPEDVIKAVPHGIYVQDIASGEVKVGQGDFSFYVSQGRLIENGKLTAPIKDVNIIGNGPKVLQNVTMVANDLEMNQGVGYCGPLADQYVTVGLGLPTCLVKSMTVGGVKQEGAK